MDAGRKDNAAHRKLNQKYLWRLCFNIERFTDRQMNAHSERQAISNQLQSKDAISGNQSAW